MSQLFGPWKRGDATTVRELIDPEAEFKSAPIDLGPKVCRGHAGIVQYRAEVFTIRGGKGWPNLISVKA